MTELVIFDAVVVTGSPDPSSPESWAVTFVDIFERAMTHGFGWLLDHDRCEPYLIEDFLADAFSGQLPWDLKENDKVLSLIEADPRWDDIKEFFWHTHNADIS